MSPVSQLWIPHTTFTHLEYFLIGQSIATGVSVLIILCLGWVCYAEKTHGNFILPYISRVKSPQQIMGSFIKDYVSNLKNKPRTDIYHLTVMPCFDKKLEASRDQFFDVDTETKDVDCVITSSMYAF